METFTDRLHTLALPGHHRGTAIRRALAAGLVLAAVCSLLFDVQSTDPTVTTFARHVPAGAVLIEDDLARVRLPAEVVPEGALADPDEAVGAILAAGAAPGEVVTKTRLVAVSYTHLTLPTNREV